MDQTKSIELLKKCLKSAEERARDTVIILHTTAHIKFLDFLVQQPGNFANGSSAV